MTLVNFDLTNKYVVMVNFELQIHEQRRQALLLRLGREKGTRRKIKPDEGEEKSALLSKIFDPTIGMGIEVDEMGFLIKEDTSPLRESHKHRRSLSASGDTAISECSLEPLPQNISYSVKTNLSF